ncbi:MAG: FAD-binding oxidoreductase [Bacteroidia bacterium]|nr:FAD-binding oxidoreductase [Bacteroidia bacterium]
MSTSNWGNYPVVEESPRSYTQGKNLRSGWIPRGMGRCYGDSSLGTSMLSLLQNNRLLAFDDNGGILRCEAGLTFESLLEFAVPKGWFPPVTPGTKFVSLGGALASDVHGKNHHKEGSISRHVLDFNLLTGKGEVLFCSREQHPEVFWATLGGMGLTGLILDLRIQLKPIKSSYIKLNSHKANSLEEILDLFEQHESWTYSVAWIDTLASGKRLGRSILLLGEHAAGKDLQIPSKVKLSIPFNFPSFTLNPVSISAFNFLYFHKHLGKERKGLTNFDSYFYPLDFLHNWNRIYGKRGFTQYQFVIPKEAGREGLSRILSWLKKHGLASFLSVLKLFGKQEGILNFPKEGYTLTLDFPINKKLFPLLEELDKMVIGYGGRVYLTKDVRLPKNHFEQMYPNHDQFREIIDRLDPNKNIRSFQSQRLGLR